MLSSGGFAAANMCLPYWSSNEQLEYHLVFILVRHLESFERLCSGNLSLLWRTTYPAYITTKYTVLCHIFITSVRFNTKYKINRLKYIPGSVNIPYFILNFLLQLLLG